MNAVDIEQAVCDLARQPFDAAGFPFAAAFGHKHTVLGRGAKPSSAHQAPAVPAKKAARKAVA
jgi:hypothetical protein